MNSYWMMVTVREDNHIDNTERSEPNGMNILTNDNNLFCKIRKLEKHLHRREIYVRRRQRKNKPTMCNYEISWTNMNEEKWKTHQWKQMRSNDLLQPMNPNRPSSMKCIWGVKTRLNYTRGPLFLDINIEQMNLWWDFWVSDSGIVPVNE